MYTVFNDDVMRNVEQKVNYHPGCLRVIHYLTRRAKKNGTVQASASYIADAVCLSVRHIKRILNMLRKAGVILTDSVKTARYSNTINVITLIPGLGESLYKKTKNDEKQNNTNKTNFNGNMKSPPSDMNVTQENLDEELSFHNNHPRPKQNIQESGKPAVVVIEDSLHQLREAKNQDSNNTLIDELILETEGYLAEAKELEKTKVVVPEYLGKKEDYCITQSLTNDLPLKTAKVTNPCSQSYYHEQQAIHSDSQQQVTNPMSSAYWQETNKQKARETMKFKRILTDKHLKRLTYLSNRFGNKVHEMVWFLKNAYLDEAYSIDKVMGILSAIAPRFSKPIQMP
ncbi:helix-turn-helix domain-containing protein [Piscirickettsia salmonis]|nr:helix-turn-helix domain-containing protein [Piscirickettsia salmonis]